MLFLECGCFLCPSMSLFLVVSLEMQGGWGTHIMSYLRPTCLKMKVSLQEGQGPGLGDAGK